MWFGTDKELTRIASGCSMFQDSDAVGFGGRLQLRQPFDFGNCLTSPEDGQAPIELVRRSHFLRRVDWLCSFQTVAPSA